MRRYVFIVLVLLSTVARGAEQQLTLEIKDGRISLEANAVELRRILNEWARVGGTRIVGADDIVGGPLTLRLVDVPEREALDIILERVAGYIVALRPVSAGRSASIYDRLLVLPTSAAPATGATDNRRIEGDAVALAEGPPTAADIPTTIGMPEHSQHESTDGEDMSGEINHHSPLATLDPYAAPVQGRLGRRADPGMVPLSERRPHAGASGSPAAISERAPRER